MSEEQEAIRGIVNVLIEPVAKKVAHYFVKKKIQVVEVKELYPETELNQSKVRKLFGMSRETFLKVKPYIKHIKKCKSGSLVEERFFYKDFQPAVEMYQLEK